MIMEPLVREMGAARQGDYWVQSFGSRYGTVNFKSLTAVIKK